MHEGMFRCEEDLEAVILHENKDAFAAIINKDLYGVAGKPPNQNIYFHSAVCFDLFCIRIFEVLAETTISLRGQQHSFSLFTGARWLVERHKDAWDVSEFVEAYDQLNSWLEAKRKVSFWCGYLSKQIEFDLSRRNVLRFIQLLSKHNLFRLTRLIKELYELCNKSGSVIKESDVLHLLEPLTEELKTNRLAYHSSYLVEMFHKYFTALNDFVILFHNPSPKISDWNYLERMSSETFRDLFFSAIRFASGYNKSHYASLKPATTKHLKARSEIV
jgi:hypothetical protein